MEGGGSPASCCPFPCSPLPCNMLPIAPQPTALHPAALHLIALEPCARCLSALWPTALHPSALERCTPLLQCSPSPAALQTAARSRVARCLLPRCLAARRLLPSSLLPVAAKPAALQPVASCCCRRSLLPVAAAARSVNSFPGLLVFKNTSALLLRRVDWRELVGVQLLGPIERRHHILHHRVGGVLCLLLRKTPRSVPVGLEHLHGCYRLGCGVRRGFESVERLQKRLLEGRVVSEYGSPGSSKELNRKPSLNREIYTPPPPYIRSRLLFIR